MNTDQMTWLATNANQNKRDSASVCWLIDWAEPCNESYNMYKKPDLTYHINLQFISITHQYKLNVHGAETN